MNGERGRTLEAPMGEGLRIEDVDPGADPRWDAYVGCHPAATVYHRGAWFQALRREYPAEAFALLCCDRDGAVHGILPLIRTRGLPFGIGGGSVGPRLSSLPRTPVAGPLASSGIALEHLAVAAAARARDLRVRLQMKAADRALDGTIDGMVGTVWRTSHVVSLPGAGRDLRFGDARTHSTIHRAVRKAERAGLVARDGESEADLEAWYRRYLEVCRHRGQPARGYRFFEALWQLLRPIGLLRLLIAERMDEGKGTIVAGNLLLVDGRTMTYAFNGSSLADQGMRPNDLLHWTAMHAANDAGFERYDLGEVSAANTGLARFKAKWGGTVERTFRYHLPPTPEESDAYDVLDSPGRMRRLALAGWQRVPLGMTALIGRRLYHYL